MSARNDFWKPNMCGNIHQKQVLCIRGTTSLRRDGFMGFPSCVMCTVLSGTAASMEQSASSLFLQSCWTWDAHWSRYLVWWDAALLETDASMESYAKGGRASSRFQTILGSQKAVSGVSHWSVSLKIHERVKTAVRLVSLHTGVWVGCGWQVKSGELV